LTHEGKSGGILSGEYGWIVIVTTPSDPLPADLAAAHAMILAQRELLTLAKSEVTVGRLEIERLKLMLAKARREQFGQSSERGKLLVEQLELAIEDLEETQAEPAVWQQRPTGGSVPLLAQSCRGASARPSCRLCGPHAGRCL
jgi:transposase